MICRDEIDSKAKEFGISAVNVERDYVFGWILCGIFQASSLKDRLVLVGGNGFRKGYLAETRFSSDLDFSTSASIDLATVTSEFERVCRFVQDMAGVRFESEKIHFRNKSSADQAPYLEGRLYFQDFYGKPGKMTLSIRLSVKELERFVLPIQERSLIHPYSDSKACLTTIQCMKLEEMLACKLKCLLQRRHSFDLYDIIYAMFFCKSVELDRTQVVSTFLRKTIFSRSPGVARKLLLGLPFDTFRLPWGKYIVCPSVSSISFDWALDSFKSLVSQLFGQDVHWLADSRYFPSELRNLILEAGSKMVCMRIVYDQKERIIEPYSLVYKQRKDGEAQEYFYAWDRTGGRSSGPGIKTFLNTGIQRLELLEEKFQPRFPVELSKAGELPIKGNFSRSRMPSRVHGEHFR